jgi:hypothetical protein
LALLTHYTDWVAECRKQGNKAQCCWDSYTQLYNAHQLPDLDPICRQQWPTCPSHPTIERWKRKKQAEQPLVDNRGKNRKGKGFLAQNPHIADKVQGAIKTLGPSASATALAKLPSIIELGLSHGTLTRYLKHLQTEKRGLWLKLTNPAAYRNSSAVKFGSRSRDLLPNSLWELDFTKNDVFLDFNGKRQRFSIGALMDVATRRFRFILSTAPRGRATADLLISAIHDWGMPTIVRPDNGSEFINQRIIDLARTADFILDPCLPGHPEGKPHIERFFHTLNHDKIPLLPSHVGHDVRTRQAKRETKGETEIFELAMDWHEFDLWLTTWSHEYHDTHHSSLGTSPALKLQEFIDAGWLPSPSPHTVEYLRKTAGDRRNATVQTYGISHQKRRYIAAELGAYINQKVVLLLDNQDPCHLWVMNAEGTEIICEAKWEVELSPAQVAAITAQAKRAASGVIEQSAAAGRIARKIGKRLEQDPLALFNDKYIQQAKADFATQAATQAHTIDLATEGKLLPPNADPTKVVALPFGNSMPRQVPIHEMIIDAPGYVAAEVLHTPDSRSQADRDLDRLNELIMLIPYDQWTDQDVRFVRNRLDQIMPVLKMFPGAPGVKDAVQNLARDLA